MVARRKSTRLLQQQRTATTNHPRGESLTPPPPRLTKEVSLSPPPPPPPPEQHQQQQHQHPSRRLRFLRLSSPSILTTPPAPAPAQSSSPVTVNETSRPFTTPKETPSPSKEDEKVKGKTEEPEVITLSSDEEVDSIVSKSAPVSRLKSTESQTSPELPSPQQNKRHGCFVRRPVAIVLPSHSSLNAEDGGDGGPPKEEIIEVEVYEDDDDEYEDIDDDEVQAGDVSYEMLLEIPDIPPPVITPTVEATEVSARDIAPSTQVNNESAGESIGGDVMTSQEEESISFPSQVQVEREEVAVTVQDEIGTSTPAPVERFGMTSQEIVWRPRSESLFLLSTNYTSVGTMLSLKDLVNTPSPLLVAELLANRRKREEEAKAAIAETTTTTSLEVSSKGKDIVPVELDPPSLPSPPSSSSQEETELSNNNKNNTEEEPEALLLPLELEDSEQQNVLERSSTSLEMLLEEAPVVPSVKETLGEEEQSSPGTEEKTRVQHLTSLLELSQEDSEEEEDDDEEEFPVNLLKEDSFLVGTQNFFVKTATSSEFPPSPSTMKTSSVAEEHGEGNNEPIVYIESSSSEEEEWEDVDDGEELEEVEKCSSKCSKKEDEEISKDSNDESSKNKDKDNGEISLQQALMYLEAEATLDSIGKEHSVSVEKFILEKNSNEEMGNSQSEEEVEEEVPTRKFFLPSSSGLIMEEEEFSLPLSWIEGRNQSKNDKVLPQVVASTSAEPTSTEPTSTEASTSTLPKRKRKPKPSVTKRSSPPGGSRLCLKSMSIGSEGSAPSLPSPETTNSPPVSLVNFMTELATKVLHEGRSSRRNSETSTTGPKKSPKSNVTNDKKVEKESMEKNQNYNVAIEIASPGDKGVEIPLEVIEARMKELFQDSQEISQKVNVPNENNGNIPEEDVPKIPEVQKTTSVDQEESSNSSEVIELSSSSPPSLAIAASPNPNDSNELSFEDQLEPFWPSPFQASQLENIVSDKTDNAANAANGAYVAISSSSILELTPDTPVNILSPSNHSLEFNVDGDGDVAGHEELEKEESSAESDATVEIRREEPGKYPPPLFGVVKQEIECLPSSDSQSGASDFCGEIGNSNSKDHENENITTTSSISKSNNNSGTESSVEVEEELGNEFIDASFISESSETATTTQRSTEEVPETCNLISEAAAIAAASAAIPLSLEPSATTLSCTGTSEEETLTTSKNLGNAFSAAIEEETEHLERSLENSQDPSNSTLEFQDTLGGSFNDKDDPSEDIGGTDFHDASFMSKDSEPNSSQEALEFSSTLISEAGAIAAAAVAPVPLLLESSPPLLRTPPGVKLREVIIPICPCDHVPPPPKKPKLSLGHDEKVQEGEGKEEDEDEYANCATIDRAEFTIRYYRCRLCFEHHFTIDKFVQHFIDIHGFPEDFQFHIERNGKEEEEEKDLKSPKYVDRGGIEEFEKRIGRTVPGKKENPSDEEDTEDEENAAVEAGEESWESCSNNESDGEDEEESSESPVTSSSSSSSSSSDDMAEGDSASDFEEEELKRNPNFARIGRGGGGCSSDEEFDYSRDKTSDKTSSKSLPLTPVTPPGSGKGGNPKNYVKCKECLRYIYAKNMKRHIRASHPSELEKYEKLSKVRNEQRRRRGVQSKRTTMAPKTKQRKQSSEGGKDQQLSNKVPLPGVPVQIIGQGPVALKPKQQLPVQPPPMTSSLAPPPVPFGKTITIYDVQTGVVQEIVVENSPELQVVLVDSGNAVPNESPTRRKSISDDNSVIFIGQDESAKAKIGGEKSGAVANKCTICEKVLSSVWSLRRHFQKVHGFLVQQANSRVKDKSAATTTKAVAVAADAVTAPTQSQETKSKSSSSSTNTNSTLVPSSTTVPSTNNKPCPVCVIVCKDEVAFETHMKLKHSEYVQAMSNNKTTPERQASRCRICSQFYKHNELLAHLNEAHRPLISLVDDVVVDDVVPVPIPPVEMETTNRPPQSPAVQPPTEENNLILTHIKAQDLINSVINAVTAKTTTTTTKSMQKRRSAPGLIKLVRDSTSPSPSKINQSGTESAGVVPKPPPLKFYGQKQKVTAPGVANLSPLLPSPPAPAPKSVPVVPISQFIPASSSINSNNTISNSTPRRRIAHVPKPPHRPAIMRPVAPNKPTIVSQRPQAVPTPTHPPHPPRRSEIILSRIGNTSISTVVPRPAVVVKSASELVGQSGQKKLPPQSQPRAQGVAIPANRVKGPPPPDKCPKCCKKFDSVQEALTHKNNMLYLHKNAFGLGAKLACAFCDEAFEVYEAACLRFHVDTSHSAQLNVVNQLEKNGIPKLFKCKVGACKGGQPGQGGVVGGDTGQGNKHFFSIQALMSHVWSHHANANNIHKHIQNSNPRAAGIQKSKSLDINGGNKMASSEIQDKRNNNEQ